MIKGKHSGELCRLQARISILCRCWGEMACFSRVIQYTHHLSLQLAEVPLSEHITAYLHTLIFISLRDYNILIFSSPLVTAWKHHWVLLLILFKPAHLVSLSLDPSASIGKIWPLSMTHWSLIDSSEITLCDSFIQLNIFTPALWCFHRQMTLQRLQRRPKTSPRRTERGSERWSSPRARTTALQRLVGHSRFQCFCLLIYTYFLLKAIPALAPFGHLYPSLKPHISKLQSTASNRC